MTGFRSIGLLLVLVLLLALSACAEDSIAVKQQYLASADAYMAEKKYKEAIVQYHNAIKTDQLSGDAYYGLAKAYEADGNLDGALREYVRAADLLPDNLDVQIKAGTFLQRSGQFEDAKERARKALLKAPQNVEAHILMAKSMAGLRDFAGAIAQAERAIALDPGQGQLVGTLGSFQMGAGNQVEAERAFKRALDLAPKDVDLRLAVADFYWRNGRLPEAEAAVKAGLQQNPQHELANRSLGLFLILSRRAAEAEPYLKAAAQASSKPDGKLFLAYYYRRQTPPNYSAAEKVLNDPTLATVQTAKVELAHLRLAQGKPDEAEKIIDGVIKASPSSDQALTMKARLLAIRNQFDEALRAAKGAVMADPQNAEAHFVLGSLYATKQDVERAITEFNEVLRLNPLAAAAGTELARLELATGRPDVSARIARETLKRKPDDLETRLVLVRSLMAKRDMAASELEARDLAAKYPTSAPVHCVLGRLRLMKGDEAGARAAFEKALTIDEVSAEAIGGIVAIDMKNRRTDAAKTRVEAVLAKRPADSTLLALAATVYINAGDSARAEQLLKSAIQSDPGNFQIYNMLASHYFQQKRLDAARTEFEKLAQKQPRPVGSLTMVASIFELQNKPEEAQKQYEAILKIDPRAAVAANNLAWLYAERGGNLDIALQLAQTAKQQLPKSPEVNDTLGWVYYKKGLPTLAVPALEAAVAGQPQNATCHYRLGLAYAKAENKPRARAALEQALKLDPAFQGADDARRVLKSLQ